VTRAHVHRPEQAAPYPSGGARAPSLGGAGGLPCCLATWARILVRRAEIPMHGIGIGPFVRRHVLAQLFRADPVERAAPSSAERWATSVAVPAARAAVIVSRTG
jgi:hypothetical protein